MINTKNFRLLYLTPMLIGIAMFLSIETFSKSNPSINQIGLFQNTIVTLISTTLFTLVPLGLFQGVIDIKKNKDFIVFLIILIGLTAAGFMTQYGIFAAILPLYATILFVAFSIVAVVLKDKVGEKCKFLFPSLTIIGLVIFHASKILEGNSLILAYGISIGLPLLFMIPLLKNKW